MYFIDKSVTTYVTVAAHVYFQAFTFLPRTTFLKKKAYLNGVVSHASCDYQQKIIQFTVSQFVIDLRRLLEEGMLSGKAISRISEKLFFA